MILAAIVLLVALVVGFVGYNRINTGLGKISSGRIGLNEKKTHATAGRQEQEVCVTCHGEMRTEKTPWHRMHLSKTFVNFQCPVCHKNVTTGERSLAGKVLIDRTICPTCHRQKFSAFNEKHQRRDWIKKHKLLRGEKTGGADIFPLSVLKEKYPKCFICHEKKELSFCKLCHEFHPHNFDWVNRQHGKRAVATDFSCLRCHEKTSWCSTQCHEGVTLPHNIPKWSRHWKDAPDAPKWRRVHFKEAAKLVEPGEPSEPAWYNPDIKVPQYRKCRKCHDSPRSLGNHADFCMQCHHDRFYQAYPYLGTPWVKFAMPFVRANGADKCWKCHQPEFCVACHTTGKKAKPGTTFLGWPD